VAVNNALMFGTGNNATGTPLDYFARVNDRAGGFGCDVVADKLLTLVPGSWYGPDHDDEARRDCLSLDWPTDQPNWLNPPYGEPEAPCARYKKDGQSQKTGKTWRAGDYGCKKKRCKKRGWHTDVYIPGCIDFMRKADAQRQRGAETWALVAARTDCEWFHEFVWDATRHVWRPGVEGEFIRGRLVFRRAGQPDPAPFPSALVVFRP
jgi:hypothetical protein